MADLGEKLTDKRLEETEKELRRLYTEAEKDLKAKVQEYTKDFLRIDKHKRELLAAGKITEEDYKRWQRGQVFIGNRWDAKVAQMARSLVNVEKTAVDIVQRGQMSCFADNTNYFEYRLDKDHGFSGNFGLYDTATVTRLVKEQPELLRRRFVDGVKCEAWNQKVIYNTITQGILQGESIPKIAQRMARDTASTDMKAMVRYARTAMTCAQNSGRLYAMRAGQKQGIYTRKMWIAVSDERTRDAHLELDGKVEELNKPFSNEIGLIMFPGDPEADDANVWNCRCALGYEYPEGQDTTSSTDDEDAEYDEWVEEHEEQRSDTGSDERTFRLPTEKPMTEEQYDEWQEENSTSNALREKFREEFKAKYGIYPEDVNYSNSWTKTNGELTDLDWEKDKLWEKMGGDDLYQIENRQRHCGYIQDADGSKAVNAYLRRGEIGIYREREMKETIAAMDRLIATTTLDRTMLVDRCAGIDALERLGINCGTHERTSRIGHAFCTEGVDNKSIVERINKEFIGSIITDKGFMSASVVPEKNVFGGSDVTFTLLAKEGTHAFISDNKRESEIVFAHGTEQEILGARVIQREVTDYEGNKTSRETIEVFVEIKQR